MQEKNLVGRCGHYCGSCIIYRAYHDSDDLRNEIARRTECDFEKVRCHGCQKVLDNGWDGDRQWGKNCAIINCLESKEIIYCYECEDYPKCERFIKWYRSNLEKGENLIENLQMIKNGKTEDWLKEEKERWTCDLCKKPISITLDKCHRCGKEIIR